MKKTRSLIEKSNRSGPAIESCGTPVILFSKLLYVLFKLRVKTSPREFVVKLL